MVADSASIDIHAMRASAGLAASFLKSMANEDRLVLLCQLTEGERSVAELEESTGILQPTLSQQLGVLRAEGLISPRREGKFVFYKIADDRVNSLLQSLQAAFCRKRRRSPG